MTDHRTVIDDNIVSLSDLTNCNTRLLDKCLEIGILTRDECHEIELHPILYDRNRHLYELIRKKDAEKFGKLVDIMDSTDTKQSSDVLEILVTGLTNNMKIRQPTRIPQPAPQLQRPMPTTPPGSSILTGADIHKIAQAMSRSADLSKRRLELFMSLGLEFADFQDPSGNPAFAFFVFTLNRWIETSPTERPPTVESLVQKLRIMNSNALADAILTLERDGEICSST